MSNFKFPPRQNVDSPLEDAPFTPKFSFKVENERKISLKKPGGNWLSFRWLRLGKLFR
jgi:hypothetical protein